MNAMLNADLSNMPVNRSGLAGFWTSLHRGVAPLGTVTDLSGRGGDATLAGTAVMTANGLDLDGSGYADTAFNGTASLPVTLCAWVQFDSLAAGRTYVLDNSPGSDGFIFRRDGTSITGLRFFTSGGLKGSTVTIPDTGWNFWAFQFTTTAVRIGVNAIPWQVNVSFAADTPVVSADTMTIGAEVTGASGMVGGVDDVMAWHRELSMAELVSLYDWSKWRHR